MKSFIVLALCLVAVTAQFRGRTRDELRLESIRLRELAAAEIRRHETLGTVGQAVEVRHLETEIAALERQIEHLDPVRDAGRLATLEHTLVTLETQLNAELTRLRPVSGVFFAPPRTREELRLEAARLRELAVAEIRRHEIAGTVGQTVEIRHLETEIAALDRQIEHLDPVKDAARLAVLENALTTLQTQLDAEIKRVHVV